MTQQTSNTTTIRVLDFSRDPWGRTIEDNPESSGDVFRRTLLAAAFKTYDEVIVDFSGLRDIPDSAFLGGAFVNLVKEDGISYEAVLEKLKVLPDDNIYPKLVRRIIMLARDEHKRVDGA